MYFHGLLAQLSNTLVVCYLSVVLLICSMDQVHLDYLEAGADIIITASYQVINTVP